VEEMGGEGEGFYPAVRSEREVLVRVAWRVSGGSLERHR